MIDPRALQQHFRKVQQNERPPKSEIPRIPDPEPLTAVHAIPEPCAVEEVLEIPEVVVPAQIEPEEIKEPINLVINADPPIDSIVINEIEEEETKDDNVYDPYGYYSSNTKY